MPTAEQSLTFLLRVDDTATQKIVKFGQNVRDEMVKLGRDTRAMFMSDQAQEKKVITDQFGDRKAFYQRRGEELLNMEKMLVTRRQELMTDLYTKTQIGQDSDQDRNLLTRTEKQLSQVRGAKNQNAAALLQIARVQTARLADVDNRFLAQDLERQQKQKEVETKLAAERSLDMHRITTRTYDATHSARQIELRRVMDAHTRMMEVYKNDPEMRRKISQSTAAEVAQVEEQHQKDIWQKLRSPRAIRFMMGGFIAGGLGQMAQGAIMSGIRGAQLQGALVAPGTKPEEMVDALLKHRDAVGNMFSWIPLLGQGIKNVVDMWGDREGVEKFAKNVKEVQVSIDQTWKAMRQGAVGIIQSRSTLLEYSSAENTRAKSQLELGERLLAIEMARESYAKAREAHAGAVKIDEEEFDKKLARAGAWELGRLKKLRAGGLPESTFTRETRERAEKAAQDIKTLEGQNRRQVQLDKEIYQSQQERERKGFWRSLEERETSARYSAPTMEAKQALDRQRQLQVHRAELIDLDEKLDKRSKDVADKGAWSKKWVTEQTAIRTTPDMNAVQRGRVIRQINKDVEGAYAEELETLRTQGYRRQELLRIQYEEELSLRKKQALERENFIKETELRIALVRLSLPTKGNLRQQERLQAEEQLRQNLQQAGDNNFDRARANELYHQTLLATNKKYDTLEQDETFKLWQETKSAEVSITSDRAALRQRELEQIRESYREQIRLSDTKAQRDRIELAITSKQRAKQAEWDKEDFFRVAGYQEKLLRYGGFGREANRMAIRADYSKRKLEATSPEELGLLGLMERRDLAVEETHNLAAKETRSIEARFATRIGGFEESPETRELKQMRILIQQQLVALGLIKDKPVLQVTKKKL